MFYVKVKNNVKIAVYDLNPTGKKTILLIHGWPFSQAIFEYQKRMLVQHDYRVVTLDLRGFGNSDAPAFGYSYDQLADDICRVVRALNLRHFVLAGFSMGGAIVLRYMHLFRGYGVKKLILMAAAAPRFTRIPGFPCGTSKEEFNKLIDLAKTDRAQLSQNFSRMLLACPHSEAIKDWFRDISLSASGIGTVETGYSLRDEDGRDDLAFVHVPTGIFHGKKDQIVPFELGMLQHKGIKDSDLYVFENSGHGIFYDELDCFNNALLSYLEEDRPVCAD